MATRRIDTWVWAMIYIGLVLFGLGLSVQRRDATLGWIIAALGSVFFAVGSVLIWVRSRMKD